MRTYYVRFQVKGKDKGMFSSMSLYDELLRNVDGFKAINNDLKSTLAIEDFTIEVKHYFKKSFILAHFKGFRNLIESGLVDMIRIEKSNDLFIVYEDNDQVAIAIN
jgi:hypothetical protein